MRLDTICLIAATTLAVALHPASAQVSVTSPAPGAAASYRTAVISWDPIPGASSYHLEIDDDPNFGSPEVDVTVAETSYALSGERLKLNGRLQWPAYVRINGVRWNSGAFSRSYFGSPNYIKPTLFVDSQNRAYLAFKTTSGTGYVATSAEWTMTPFPAGDGGLYFLAVAVDENGVIHAFFTGGGSLHYANSSTGWNLVHVAALDSPCYSKSLVVGGGQVDLFCVDYLGPIDRWTSTDGMQFTWTTVPNSDPASGVSAARDGLGNLYVAWQDTVPNYVGDSFLQTSADGWIPHTFGSNGNPSLAVTSTGELHVLRWGIEVSEWDDRRAVYSNSLRGFETWTVLPAQLPNFNYDEFRLVVDQTRDRLVATLPGRDGIHVCTTGLATGAGTSWTCTQLGNDYDIPGSNSALAVAPDGTIHVAWTEGINGLTYANSLGSFLATNIPPQVNLGAPSSTASAVVVPAEIFEADGDSLSGDIRVGRYESVISHIAPGATAPIMHGEHTLENVSNSYIQVQGWLDLQVAGSIHRVHELHRLALPPLPVVVQVRDEWPRGVFVIEAWDDTGVTISQMDFHTYVALAYHETPLAAVDISALPDGELVLAVAAWDGTTPVQRLQAFTKAAGQDQLLLTPPPPPAEKCVDCVTSRAVRRRP